MTTAFTDRTLEAFAGNKVEVPVNITILDKGVEFPEVKGTCRWRVLSQKDGDSRLTWNNMNIAEINAAQDMFEDMIENGGMEAFKVGVDGQMSSEKMTEFDPHAEEVIFMPMKAIVGG
jgi:hypothetical protein